MALSQKSCTLLLAVLAAVCIELYQAQHSLGRCSCDYTVKFIREEIIDFQIIPRHPRCDKTEVIVTMVKSDNSTAKICMDTQRKLAKAFLMCWENINRDESRKMECVDKKRKSE